MFIATRRPVEKQLGSSPDPDVARWLRILTSSEPAFARAFTGAMRATRESLSLAELARGIASNAAAAEAAIPWEVFNRRFQRGLATAMPNAMEKGATLALTRLQAPSAFWNNQSPEVLNWLSNHSAQLVREIDRGTRQAIRQALTRAYREGLPPGAAAKQIRDVIGLTRRQEMAVTNFRQALIDTHAAGGSRAAVRQQYQLSRGILRGKGPIDGKRIDQLTAAYRDRMIKHRAETIARHEAAVAANEGKFQMLKKAKREGLLPATMVIEWLVTPDERTCDICLPLHGEQVPLGQSFSVGVTHPPAHIKCRCDTVVVREPTRRLLHEHTLTTDARVGDIVLGRESRRAAREAATREGLAAARRATVEGARSSVVGEAISPTGQKGQNMRWQELDGVHGSAAEVYGTPAEDWLQNVRADWEDVPVAIRRALDDQNFKLTLSKRIDDYNTVMAKRHPRGWPPGTTWRSASGWANYGRRQIAMMEEYRPIRSTKWIREPHRRRRGVLFHETGHAVDDLGIRRPNYYMKWSEPGTDFRNLYTKLRRKKIDPAMRRKLSYFLQKGDAGASEAFAEAFALATGEGSGTWLQSEFQQVFGELIDFIKAEVIPYYERLTAGGAG